MESVDGRQELHRVGLEPRLSLLAREQLGDLVGLVEEHLRRAAQIARAVRKRKLRPEGLNVGDVVHDRLHLVGRDGRHCPDQLAGRGVV